MNKFILVSMLTILVAIPTTASAVTLPSEESGQHSVYCTNEWTKRGVLNQGLFDYCMKEQHEGYLGLQFLASKYSNQSWIQQAIDFSVQRWTKKGVRQDHMVEFKLKQITEGFEDLLYKSEQPGWNQKKYEACLRESGIEFNSVNYCYDH